MRLPDTHRMTNNMVIKRITNRKLCLILMTNLDTSKFHPPHIASPLIHSKPQTLAVSPAPTKNALKTSTQTSQIAQIQPQRANLQKRLLLEKSSQTQWRILDLQPLREFECQRTTLGINHSNKTATTATHCTTASSPGSSTFALQKW